MQLSIPDTIVQSVCLPEKKVESELLKELAISLYQQELLSFGKARELAKMEHYDFGKLLGERKIPRHYSSSELEEDLSYAEVLKTVELETSGEGKFLDSLRECRQIIESENLVFTDDDFADLRDKSLGREVIL